MTDTTQKIENTLQNTVNEILHKAVDAASATGDFLKDQIPDVCKELLAFTMVRDIMVIVFTGFLYWFFYKLVFKWTNQKLDSIDCWDMSKLISAIVGGFVVVSYSTIAIVSFLELLKVIFAPKLFLLEYAAHLIK